MLQILFRQYLKAPQTGCVFDPLADSDDNDLWMRNYWLIELEYELPTDKLDPDCDWLTETEVLMLKLIQGRGTQWCFGLRCRYWCRNWNQRDSPAWYRTAQRCWQWFGGSRLIQTLILIDVETDLRRRHWFGCWYWSCETDSMLTPIQTLDTRGPDADADSELTPIQMLMLTQMQKPIRTLTMIQTLRLTQIPTLIQTLRLTFRYRRRLRRRYRSRGWNWLRFRGWRWLDVETDLQTSTISEVETDSTLIQMLKSVDSDADTDSDETDSWGWQWFWCWFWLGCRYWFRGRNRFDR